MPILCSSIYMYIYDNTKQQQRFVTVQNLVTYTQLNIQILKPFILTLVNAQLIKKSKSQTNVDLLDKLRLCFDFTKTPKFKKYLKNFLSLQNTIPLTIIIEHDPNIYANIIDQKEIPIINTISTINNNSSNTTIQQFPLTIHHLRATIVRILKKRIKVSYDELFELVAENIYSIHTYQLTPDNTLYTNAIESLLDEEYISRDTQNRKLLQYVP